MGYGSANNIEKVLLSWAGNWLCDPPNAQDQRREDPLCRIQEQLGQTAES